jgi:hypothetical protein
MSTASRELCLELYELIGWGHDEDYRPIEKIWMRNYHTSEMWQGHPDYNTTSERERKQVVVGDWHVTFNFKNQIGVPEVVFNWWWSDVQKLKDEAFPAYDTDFILRKLDVFYDTDFILRKLDVFPIALQRFHVQTPVEGDDALWGATVKLVKIKAQAADTPADAMCKTSTLAGCQRRSPRINLDVTTTTKTYGMIGSAKLEVIGNEMENAELLEQAG